MTPKERITAALLGEDVDYTPCVPTFWTGAPEREAFKWRDEEEMLEFLLRKLGVDAVLWFSIPHSQPPFRSWVEQVPGERYPLLHSEVDTPKGKLRATVRKTDDYPYDHVPFFSDWAVSRYVKPWIETLEDVEKFASTYRPPDGEVLSEAEERLEHLRKLGEKWNVPVVGAGLFALNAPIHLMGAERAVLTSVDSPEVIDSLNEVVHSVNRRKLETMLSWGVKIVVRNGWYDTTDFWSPKQYERWVVPHLREDIELVRSADGIFVYQACTGIRPLLPILRELDFHCLLEPEPVLGGIDMAELKKALPGKSFWGGISAPVHIGEGTPEKVRKAVREAFSAFGKRGFILKAVPSIRAHWPWENVLAMVDEWKRLRYPREELCSGRG